MRQVFCVRSEQKCWGLTRILLFSVTLMLLAAVIFSVHELTFQPRHINLDVNTNQVNSFVEITKNTDVTQRFHYDKALYGLSVLFRNPNNFAAGHVTIKVRDLSTGLILCDETLEAQDIADGEFFFLGFGDKITSEKGYEIIVSSEDAESGTALSIWMSDTISDEIGGACINGRTASSTLAFSTCEEDVSYQPMALFINRLVLVSLFFSFLLLHFFVDIRRLYEWIFHKRFWIAAAVVVFFVINQYNFSSICLYNEYFQYNYGSGYLSTILGQVKAIRSDEWVVVTPARLSAKFTEYAKINDILQAASNENFPITGLYFCFAALSRPTLWGYFLLGSAYGLSFSNITYLVGTFLVSFETLLILTKRKRLYSLLGGVLITCSSCFLWWSNVSWIMSAQGVFVCIYYFLQSEKHWKRVLLILGMAVFGSNFITELYPAWQVPVGYLFLTLIIWMLIDNRKRVKALKKWDWVIVAAGLACMAVVCVSSLWESKGYINTIMHTAYPGRRSSSGGYAMDKLFGDLKVWSTSLSGIKNMSYEGVFLSFYPLPSLISIYLLVKKKCKDGLLLSLMAVSLILTVYCTVGFPDFLAQATLLSYSIPYRACDVVGFIEVYLLILCLCRLEDMKRPKLIISIPAMILLGVVSAFLCAGKMTSLPELGLAAAALLCAAILFSDIGEKYRRGAAICLIAVSVACGACVLPLSKGIGVMNAKPVSREIRMLNEDGTKRWITVNSYLSGNFLAANGAPAVTSINFTPNYELWSAIDPDGNYKYVYDRYAHCQIRFCQEDTHFVLEGTDRFVLYLSYKDIYKFDADYIFCTCKLEDNPYIHFEQIYYEGGVYIYKPVILSPSGSAS